MQAKKKPCEVLATLKKIKESSDTGNKWVFRGLSNTKTKQNQVYPCITSFARWIRDNAYYLENIERVFSELSSAHNKLIVDLKGLTANQHLDDKSVWTYIQHYHGNTNLLDVTFDPMMAIAFATKFGTNTKGRVIAFKVTENMKDKPQKSKISLLSTGADISKFITGSNSKYSYDEETGEPMVIGKITDCEVTELIKSGADKKEIDKAARESHDYCVSLIDPLNIVWPDKPSIIAKDAFFYNKRIKEQTGAFLYCNRHFHFNKTSAH